LEVRLGFASDKGPRPDNQDYVAAQLGSGDAFDPRGVVAAVADGVGGHRGGRQAAELTVRCFIDGYYAMPATLGVKRSAARALDAINRWIHEQGRQDAALAGMGCTFSCVLLSRRSAHVVHVGDSRVYRLTEGRLERLTEDHVLGRGDLAHVLRRAIGFEAFVQADHLDTPLRPHDRFLICSDGAHGALNDKSLLALLEDRAAPEETAARIVAAALRAGTNDNATALVIDVVELPLPGQDDLTSAMAALPILPPPEPGDAIDGFRVGEVLSKGHNSRLFRATDAGRDVALKFPLPRAASEDAFRLAFAREAWVAARVRSRWIGEILDMPAGRQSRLYSVMPYYEGETLERRLARSPFSLTHGVRVAVLLARAVDALHRVGVIHRDIKPENVILDPDGAPRLIDLGVARVPGLEEFPAPEIPGTPSFMAPELFEERSRGDEASDIYALGVTVYRMFTGSYPYGEVEPFMKPRFGKYTPLSRARPDLPAWLDVALARAVSVDPARRFGDAVEFAHELEQGSRLAGRPPAARRSLLERDPAGFWRLIAAALAIALIATLARSVTGHLR
jgi:serine/threonine protein phosphatase PrpC